MELRKTSCEIHNLIDNEGILIEDMNDERVKELSDEL